MKKQKNKGRRNFLIGLGTLGMAGIIAWFMRRPIIKRLFFSGDFDTGMLTTAPSIDSNSCILTSRQVEGPFYFPSPERSDIVEDRLGQKLQFRLQVTRYPECLPVEGAVVDIWHCDAEGIYSGYPAEIARDVWETMLFGLKEGTFEDGELHVDPVNDSRFLRGLQKTDADGWVTFNTIIPGWYEGRVPHIHARVALNNQEQLTTQFYFREEILNNIYTAIEPYTMHGKCPLNFEKDIVLSQGESAAGLLLEINDQHLIDGRLTAAGRIGIHSDA